MKSVDGCQLQYDDGLVDVVIDHGPDNLFTTDMCDALATCLEAPPAGAHVLSIRAQARHSVWTRAVGNESERARGGNRCLGPAQPRDQDDFPRDGRTSARRSAGFGVGVAALCDVAVAGPSTRVWFPEVDINLVPSVVLTWLPSWLA